MSEQNYYAKEDISNSDLGELKMSPRRFVMRKQQEMQTKSGAMQLGTLIHQFTLEPENFVMADVEPVGGKMGEYIKAYFELEKSGIPEDKISDTAYRAAQYKESHSKPNTVYKSFRNKPENVAFYEFLKKADGKIALNNKDKQIIEGCLMSLRSHVVANKLLFAENGENIESFNEKEMYFEQEGVNCKSKLDRVIVNHNDKTVTLVDLKTTSSQVYGECISLNTKTGVLLRDWHVTGFMYSCLQYSYHRQLAFYENALQAEYPDYTVESFIIAIDTKGSYDCAIYKLPNEWLVEGREEIKCLLSEYKHYKQSNVWDVKQGYENVVTY